MTTRDDYKAMSDIDTTSQHLQTWNETTPKRNQEAFNVTLRSLYHSISKHPCKSHCSKYRKDTR